MFFYNFLSRVNTQTQNQPSIKWIISSSRDRGRFRCTVRSTAGGSRASQSGRSSTAALVSVWFRREKTAAPTPHCRVGCKLQNINACQEHLFVLFKEELICLRVSLWKGRSQKDSPEVWVSTDKSMFRSRAAQNDDSVFMGVWIINTVL